MRQYSIGVQFPNAGPETLEVRFPDTQHTATPDAHGAAADGVSDDSAAFAEAFAECNVVACVPGRVYGVSAPVVLQSGQTLELRGAILRALPDFTGSAVVLVKQGDGTQPAWYSHVTGGTVDGAFLADPIEVYYGRQCDLSYVKTTRPLLYGVNIGTAAQASTGINCHRVEAWFHEGYTPVAGHEVNPPGSIGIRYDNCTDSYASQCFAVGFRTGFDFNGGAVEYSHCHAWGRRAHGPFVTGFRAGASSGSYAFCYADTPHNWRWDGAAYVQDAAITEVYGFDLHGYSQHLVGCQLSINAMDAPNYGATDGLVVPVNMGGELAGGGYGYIIGLNLTGASTSYRYKKHFGGSTNNAVILGTNDGGSSLFIDNSTRGDKLRAVAVGDPGSSAVNLRINGKAAASGSLPAAPSGYVTANINGQNVRLYYYPDSA